MSALRTLLPAGIVVAAAAVSLWVTAATRRYAERQGILDRPNDRSSHTRPTPRGGGLGIAAGLGAGVLLLWATGELPGRLALALGGGGLVVAGVGWWDDRKSLPARWRFLAQLAAAGWAVWWIGGLPELELGFARVHLGWAGAPLAVLGLVWLTNLYNFMDGTDGIAGGEAVAVGAVAGCLLLAFGAPALGWTALAIAAASAGFLCWNWPPAQIFMGDVGSGLLGFALGVVALGGENAGALPLGGALILLGVFVVDATITLARRAARGERWYEAHRSHAYQHAVQQGASHRRVVLAVLVLDLAWLAPLALLTAARHELVLPALALAWAPLAWLCWRYNSGGKSAS